MRRTMAALLALLVLMSISGSGGAAPRVGVARLDAQALHVGVGSEGVRYFEDSLEFVTDGSTEVGLVGVCGMLLHGRNEFHQSLESGGGSHSGHDWWVCLHREEGRLMLESSWTCSIAKYCVRLEVLALHPGQQGACVGGWAEFVGPVRLEGILFGSTMPLRGFLVGDVPC